MQSNPKKLQYGVIGNPIGHSKSPLIHQLFARQFNIELEYHAIEAGFDQFMQTVNEFRDHLGLGLNVTVPFKLEAFEFANQRSERAELAGAVNTLKFNGEEVVFGDNTDGVGLYRDFTRNLNQPIEAKRVLVLGAGGAVRGILGPLLEVNPQCVVIANRTVSKAQDLAELFVSYGDIIACGFDALVNQQFDIIVNGTASSLSGELPPISGDVFSQNTLAYDMMYADHPTPFMRWASTQGAGQVADGLGMLVEQAAESFFIWHSVRPDTGTVINTLRS